MGIRGLTTFLLNNWRICEHLNLEENTNFKIIVVDGNSFSYWFYNYFHLTSTCDYCLVNELLKTLLNIFLKYNIQLIFIFDGYIAINKLFCKLERLSTQSTTIYNNNQSNNNNNSNNRIFSSNPIPLLAIESIIQCLKESCFYLNGYELPNHLHCFHIISSGEADKLIVDIAVKVHAFGILSNDSDMLIYNLSSNYFVDISFIPLWSLQYNLNESNIGIYFVKREKIANLLHLPPENMWLLAVLLGNDLSNFQLLNKLHELLYLWSRSDNNNNNTNNKNRNKIKSNNNKSNNKSNQITNKVNSNSSISLIQEVNSNINSSHNFINNIVKIIPSQLEQSRNHQYKMTSQDTIKITLRLLSRVMTLCNYSTNTTKTFDEQLHFILTIIPCTILSILMSIKFDDIYSIQMKLYTSSNNTNDSCGCIETNKKMSKIQNQIKLFLEYFSFTYNRYRLSNDYDLLTYGEYQQLHIDLQLVINSNIFLPRVSFIENYPLNNESFQIYDHLLPIRLRLYNLLLKIKEFQSKKLKELKCKDHQQNEIEEIQGESKIIHEIIFKQGHINYYSYEINNYLDNNYLCNLLFNDNIQNDFLSKSINYLIGRNTNPLSLLTISSPIFLDLNQITLTNLCDQDFINLINTIKISSIIILHSFKLNNNNNRMIFVSTSISFIFSTLLTYIYPNIFVIESALNQSIIEERKLKLNEFSSCNNQFDVNFLLTWSLIEVVLQHTEYILDLGYFYQSSMKSSHLIPYKHLNRVLFNEIMNYCYLNESVITQLKDEEEIDCNTLHNLFDQLLINLFESYGNLSSYNNSIQLIIQLFQYTFNCANFTSNLNEFNST